MRTPLLHHLHDYFFPHSRNKYRPHLFSATSIAVFVFAIVLFEAGYLVQTKIVFLKTDFLASVLPGALVALTNQDRIAHGVPKVTENALLDAAAQAVAQDMATKSYFAHVSPDGKTPWQWLDQVGYHYNYAGENLAVNFTDSTNVESAWMASPTHRANIVKPQYTQVGFGTASGVYEGKESIFVVEFFATPAVSKALPGGVTTAPIRQAATQVLGSETSPSSGAPIGWFTSLLASPLNTLLTICMTLFAVIAVSCIATLFMRGRVQHPSVVFGSVFLCLLIIEAMLMGIGLAGSIHLPAGGQAASVYLASPSE